MVVWTNGGFRNLAAIVRRVARTGAGAPRSLVIEEWCQGLRPSCLNGCYRLHCRTKSQLHDIVRQRSEEHKCRMEAEYNEGIREEYTSSKKRSGHALPLKVAGNLEDERVDMRCVSRVMR